MLFSTTENLLLSSELFGNVLLFCLGPPGPPVIVGYDGKQLLRKGDRHRLTCVSDGGNPLATLRWFKDTKELSATNTRQNEDSSVSELDIVLAESDNGAEYKCQASNSATDEFFSNSTILRVACEFNVSLVDISVVRAN